MAACAWGAVQDNIPPAPLDGVMSAQMLRMLTGIRKYHEHPYVRTPPARDVVWSGGAVRLLHCRAAGEERAAVFLIPSLINGADILDLMPERSLVAWLGERGISSFLLDWGDLAGDGAAESFDDLFASRILPAFESSQRRAKGPVHVLGYCMGGLLAASLACLRPDSVASLMMLASPWDFHAGDQTLSDRVRAWAPGARSMAESLGQLPVDWLQILFASVDPLMAAHKFVRFADMPEHSDTARMFVAVEDWLNAGSDLPAGIARTCIEEWYTENSPARGEWRVGGQAIIPDRVLCPVLVVASGSDRLVPLESSVAFCAGRAAGSYETLAPACGHIGMMAGRGSVSEVWAPMEDWIVRHSGPGGIRG